MAISNNLQPKEIEFLKFQKSRGFNAEESFKKLQIARDKGLFTKGISAISSTSTTPVSKTTTTTPVKEEKGLLGKVGDFLGGTEKVISGGIESTGKAVIEGAKDITEGALSLADKASFETANFLRKKLGKPELTKEQAQEIQVGAGSLDTTIQEDLLDIGQGSLVTGLTAVFPGSTVLLNTAAETKGGQSVLIPLSEAIATGGAFVNKTPGLKEFRDSLPEDRQKDFDAFTAQVIMLGTAKSIEQIKAQYKDAKIAKLNKQAEQLVNEFIKPTKETTKQITKQITPEILERKITGTREQVLETAKTGVEQSGKAIGEFIKEGKVKGEVSIDKLVDVLAKEDAALRFQGKVLPGKESQVKFINDTLDFLEGVQKQTGTSLTPEAQITLKRAFDTVFDKTVTRDKITKFQDDLQVKLADTLRNELSQNNPDFAKLNRDYTFYKNLEKVMEQTDLRTTGQSAGLGTIIEGGQKGAFGAGVGAAAGGAVAGPGGAVVGATLGAALGAKLQAVVSNPKWKLVTANKKANLAKTLAEGNPAKIETLLNSFAVTLGINE